LFAGQLPEGKGGGNGYLFPAFWSREKKRPELLNHTVLKLSAFYLSFNHSHLGDPA